MIGFSRFHSKAGARPRPGLVRCRGVRGGGLLLLSFCSNLYFFQHPVLTSPPSSPPQQREKSPPHPLPAPPPSSGSIAAGEHIALLRLLRLSNALRVTITSKEFLNLRVFHTVTSVLNDPEFWTWLFVMCRALYAPM
jgi:hypothetical protein